MKLPRIGIVMGSLEQPRVVQGFEYLRDQFEINFFATESPKLLNAFKPSSRMYLFEDIRDMPGYMRGLEDFASQCDVLIGVDTSRLATFQMVRIAAKYKIPCAVMVGEFHPFFYANYPNIRAIQSDVHEHANKFLPMSSLAQGMLRVEGIRDERISPMKPFVDVSRFEFNASARARFRNYVGMKPDEILILSHGELEAHKRPQDLLSAFRVLRATDPMLASQLRLMFVGNGSMARELKYHCFDYRLGNSVLFLHQDPEPLLHDLYCASDVRVYCSSAGKEMPETFPLSVLESTVAGALPVFKTGSLAAEYLQGSGVAVPDEAFVDYSDAFAKIFRTPGFLERERLAASAHVKQTFDMARWVEQMQAEIAALLELAQGRKNVDTEQFFAEIRNLVARGDKQKALDMLDGFQAAKTDLPAKHKAELLQLRGDVYFEMSEFDDAMVAYEQALQIDEANYLAYRGLGNIAFRGHSYEDALTFFKKALSKREDDAASLLGIGLVHRRLGLHDDALFWLEKAVSVEDHSHRSVAALIQTCLESPRVKKAIEVLERVVEQGKDSSNLLMTLGQLHVRAGQVELGNELIRKASEMDANATGKPGAA